MKKFCVFSLSVLLALPLFLGSCSDTFKTPETDNLHLNTSFEGQTFTMPADGNNAIGEVTLTGVTDGDTMNFLDGRIENPNLISTASSTCRLLGINTPESTAQVQPWGVKASNFVKNILWDGETSKQKVHSVVLQNDYSAFGVTDNTSSNRYMAFLWYQVNEGDDYRLLNLELIEQCYTANQLSQYSSFCPYLDVFIRAALAAKESGRRVNGERDPDYDYTNQILDVSIHELRENYPNYGVTEEEGGSGVRLRVTAVIIGMIEHNFVFRDVVDPDGDGVLADIYCFVGYGKSYRTFYHVGDIITVYCRATTYGNNIQLTDLQDDFALGKGITRLINVESYDIKTHDDWLDETKVNNLQAAVHALDENYVYDLSPTSYVESATKPTTTDELEDMVGKFVTIDLTIRAADENDDAPTDSSEGHNYYRMADDGDYTAYAYVSLTTLKVNFRVDFAAYGSKNVDFFVIGQTYRATGYFSRYYNTFQLQLMNNLARDPYFDTDVYGDGLVRGYVYPIN